MKSRSLAQVRRHPLLQVRNIPTPEWEYLLEFAD